MKPRNTITSDWFAAIHRRANERKVDKLGDPLQALESCIDFAALAQAVDTMTLMAADLGLPMFLRLGVSARFALKACC